MSLCDYLRMRTVAGPGKTKKLQQHPSVSDSKLQYVEHRVWNT